MEKTTIALTREAKEKMQEIGYKGESYSNLIIRLVESAKKRQLHDFLMNEEGCVPVKEALERAKKKWQK